jgi:hypothetical protein
MKRLTVETKKSIANLLLNTAIKRIFNEKKYKDTCDMCKTRIHKFIESNRNLLIYFVLPYISFVINYFDVQD